MSVPAAASSHRPQRILMVCTGNICRSTMAHAILEQEAARAGVALTVDSAGISDEEHGNPIDPRAARALREAGYDVPAHRARQIRASELGEWDLILAMTGHHYSALKRLASMSQDPHSAGMIRMYRDYDPECAHLPEGPGAGKDLPDPWYGTYRDFLDTLAVIERATPHLLDEAGAASR